MFAMLIAGMQGATLGARVAGAEGALDTEAPSAALNLTATPTDGGATLSWDAATDDTGVTGYFIYSSLKPAAENGGSYTFGSMDAGNKTKVTLESLSNGVTYYFAVTAYDSAENESEYSNEVDVTPEESTTGDFISPTVTDATAITSTLVEVTFSEDVVLPEDAASAFSVEATDGTAMEILDAYLSEDASTVFLVTDTQIAGAQYMLTAGMSITDKADNPVESGTSDTAVFTGSSLSKVETGTTDTGDTGDTGDGTGTTTDDGFKVEGIEANDANLLELAFSQKIITADPSDFTIQLADDATELVDVLSVTIDSEDATKVTLLTEDMKAGYDYVLTIAETVTNEDGATLPELARTLEFTAKTVDLADVIAPEDITNLLSKAVDETTVSLTWTGSLDSAGDLAKYLVYQSTDGGKTFGSAIELAAAAVSYNKTGLTPGATYTFRVSAVDSNGNESQGIMTTVTLPEAGPEMLILGLIALGGAAFRRKKEV
jgi:hypothetical protein